MTELPGIPKKVTPNTNRHNYDLYYKQVDFGEVLSKVHHFSCFYVCCRRYK